MKQALFVKSYHGAGIYTNLHHGGMVKVSSNNDVGNIDSFVAIEPFHGIDLNYWRRASILEAVHFIGMYLHIWWFRTIEWIEYHTISKELGLVGREIVCSYFEHYKPWFMLKVLFL
jgi:hypothetical protein